MRRRRYIIEREKPSGLPSWIAYAATIADARRIAHAQPVVFAKRRDGSEVHCPVRIVHGRGKRYGEVIERV
jgi:hypothetical protein